MSYRFTTYDAIQANISAAGSIVMLCRANLERADLSKQDTADMLCRIERQITELKRMRRKLAQLADHSRSLPAANKPNLQPVD